jgi:hypothetical protein
MKLLQAILLALIVIDIPPALAEAGEREISAESAFQFIANKLPERLCAPPKGIIPKCFDGVQYNKCTQDIFSFTLECFKEKEPKYENIICHSQEDCKRKFSVIRKGLVTCAAMKFEIKYASKSNGVCK